MIAKTTDKNVIQSYLFSRVRAKFNVYELRVMMRVVEYAQCELQGLIIANHKALQEHGLAGKIVEIPISAVLTDGGHHYERVISAAKSMMAKIVEHYDTNTQDWMGAPLVSAAKTRRGMGTLILVMQPWVWDCILDFTKGFVKYDLGVALRLKSAFSIRLYFLMSNQKSPICYSFNELKRLFGVSDKYPRTHDFIKKVLLPAKKELDAASPWSCDLRPMKDGRRLETCMFYPYEQKEKYSPGVKKRELYAKTPTIWSYHEVYQYLRYNIGFSPVELGANKQLIENFSTAFPDALERIADMNYRANRREQRPGKGWFIQAMRGELEKIVR